MFKVLMKVIVVIGILGSVSAFADADAGMVAYMQGDGAFGVGVVRMESGQYSGALSALTYSRAQFQIAAQEFRSAGDFYSAGAADSKAAQAGFYVNMTMGYIKGKPQVPDSK